MARNHSGQNHSRQMMRVLARELHNLGENAHTPSRKRFSRKTVMAPSGNPGPQATTTEFGELSLAVACPMANEGPDGVLFVRQVLAECDGFRQVCFFAVLDRATTDDSILLLREYADTEPRLIVVWAPENRCAVDAYIRGYREALAWGADWILEIDAGFSHQPQNIRQFFCEMQRGYDCVFGSRFMRGGSIRNSSWKRYLISRGGTFLTNLIPRYRTQRHDQRI